MTLYIVLCYLIGLIAAVAVCLTTSDDYDRKEAVFISSGLWVLSPLVLPAAVLAITLGLSVLVVYLVGLVLFIAGAALLSIPMNWLVGRVEKVYEKFWRDDKVFYVVDEVKD